MSNQQDQSLDELFEDRNRQIMKAMQIADSPSGFAELMK